MPRCVKFRGVSNSGWRGPQPQYHLTLSYIDPSRKSLIMKDLWLTHQFLDASCGWYFLISKHKVRRFAHDIFKGNFSWNILYFHLEFGVWNVFRWVINYRLVLVYVMTWHGRRAGTLLNDWCPSWRTHICHDDVIKWEHFPRYWPFVRGIHRSPVNSPHKGQWRGALMFSLICVWINGWINNIEAGDLRHYRAHYGVIVMVTWPQLVYSLQLSDAMWRHRAGSTLGQVISHCLTSPIITWTSGKSVRSNNNQLRVISQEIPQPSIIKLDWNITTRNLILIS